MSRETSSIATFLLAFENLTFLQASVAMLDVFFVTFMMASFLLYINRRYIATGFSIGLGALAKLDGALAAPVIFFHWLFSRQRRSWWFFLAAFFAVIGFVELMIPLDYIITRTFHNLADPLHRIQTMLQLTGSLTFANVTHPNLSRPWEWLLTYKPMAYWIMPHYTAAISFTIWALAFPSVGYMIYKAIKRSEAGIFGLAWFFGTWGIMSILSVVTNRASYPFYFYPVVGLSLHRRGAFHRRPAIIFPPKAVRQAKVDGVFGSHLHTRGTPAVFPPYPLAPHPLRLRQAGGDNRVISVP